MIDLSPFSGQRFYVVGLGASGASAARALSAAGAVVEVWDDGEGLETPYTLIKPEAQTYEGLAALILAPGIPLTHPKPYPAAELALRADVPVISDVELAFRAGLKAKAIGITGTNGKSTTTALVHHALTALGQKSVIRGNFGVPILDCDDPGPEGFMVLELSSYQLDLSPGYPLAAACLLNISPDHLDRHGGLAGYAKAKARIFNQAEAKIVTGDDAECLTIAKDSGATLLGPADWQTFLETPALRGTHNQQNQAAACALLEAVGFERAAIVEAFQSFPGIAHRQEILGENDTWLFVNDSKATNVDSAIRALGSFETIHWLAGGLGKEGDASHLIPALTNVQIAYLYGENKDDLAALCLEAGTPHQLFDTLDQAFAAAMQAPGGTLLLSPAAASWDQYKSFEARGDHFRVLVQPYLTPQEVAA